VIQGQHYRDRPTNWNQRLTRARLSSAFADPPAWVLTQGMDQASGDPPRKGQEPLGREILLASSLALASVGGSGLARMGIAAMTNNNSIQV